MKFKIILGLLLLVSLASSCNKWLDVKPTSELDGSELFSSEKGFVEALAGVYSNLSKPALYGRELSYGMLDVMGGVYIDYQISGDYLNFLQYKYKRNNSNYVATTSTTIAAIWGNMYNQIAQLNSILANIDQRKNIFSGQNYSIIKGETIGLRAYLHLELLKLFGPSFQQNGASTLSIPYVTELGKKVSPLLTGDQVITEVIKDLNESKELLKQDPIFLGTAPDPNLVPYPTGNFSAAGISVYHNRRFSFNYYATVAALAKAYLWKGDRANALLNAQEIISAQSSRFPWVKPEFLANISSAASPNQDRTFATEHIFALNIRDLNEYMDGYIYFGALSNNNVNSSGLLPLAFHRDAPSNFFEGSQDPRKLYLVNISTKGNFSSKFYQVAGVAPYFSQRLPLIRVSEMYYIAAECDDNLQEARTYMNTVRANRGMSSTPLSETITRNELDNSITAEYKREFIGEGQMWYLLKRKNIDLTKSQGSSYNIWYTFTNMDQYVFDRPDEEDAYRQ